MKVTALVVHVPANAPLAAASIVRCRVGRDGRWGAPGDVLAARPGRTTVSIHARAATPTLQIDATLEVPVDIAPDSITELRLSGLSLRKPR